MRFRKTKKGKIPPVAVFTENDILEACYEYLKQRNYKTGDMSIIKIALPKKDKRGRKRRSRVEVMVEYDPAHKPDAWIVDPSDPTAGGSIFS